MKKVCVLSATVLLSFGVAVQAAITIDTVTIGDPRNAADTTGYGSVSYTYNIGKYEVTAGQYTAFLNAVAKTDTYGLYDSNMANTAGSSSSFGCGINRSGSSGSYSYTVDAAFVNRPVNWVSYWDACRFTNWLSNGQKTGGQDATTTEKGTYTLDGYNASGGGNIQRNTIWKWAITSENEWYKAAYYKGGGTTAGYWLYPTQSNTAPGRDMNDTSGNNANYNGNPFPIQSPYYTTIVGEFQNSDSAYGTFDQAGNVWEWNEAIVGGVDRGLRGSSYGYDTSGMLSTFRDGYYPPNLSYCLMGFRVSQAYAPVPEPSTILVLLAGLAGVIGSAVRRRR